MGVYQKVGVECEVGEVVLRRGRTVVLQWWYDCSSDCADSHSALGKQRSLVRTVNSQVVD